MFTSTLIIQMAYTAVVVDAIITHQIPETRAVKFVDPQSNVARKMNSNSRTNKIQTWQSTLKDATFRSLIKHTGFTPSLEEKLESDRLVWEKLQSSKFTKKPKGKSDDAMERVKMGVLIDMTPDGGTLEFRQSDRNVYQCPDGKCDTILRRLLAIWKVERFEPNDMWIRIKVPRATKEEEDVYEYTPKYGLQEMNTRFYKSENKTVTSPPTTTVALTTSMAATSVLTNLKEENGPLLESLTTLPILDERLIAFGDRKDVELPDQQKPISYQIQANEPADDLLESQTTLPMKISKKVDYNIFNQRKPISYGTKIRNSKYFGKPDTKPIPEYNPYSAIHVPLPVTEEASQYSEFFFQEEPLVTAIIKNDPQIPKEFINKQNFYDGFLPSLGPTGSPFASTVSKYAYEITHPAPQFYEAPKQKNVNNFQPSPLFVQYSELDPIFHGNEGSVFVYEDTRPQPDETTFNTTKPLTETSKNTTDPLQDEPPEQADGSVNVLRFAGANGNEIRVSTKTMKRPIKSKNVTTNEQDGDQANIEISNKAVTTLSSNDTEPTTTGNSNAENTTKPTKADEISDSETDNTSMENMMIENINNKSPEEIVNTLTNMGIKNATRIEGYPPVSDETLEASSKMLEKIKKSEDKSDPISVIVNRVSQSYSYRTAKGKIKNFLNKRRIV